MGFSGLVSCGIEFCFSMTARGLGLVSDIHRVFDVGSEDDTHSDLVNLISSFINTCIREFKRHHKSKVLIRKKKQML